MLDFLKPDLYVGDLQQVPLDQLVRGGIRGLVVDLDNTLTEWNDDLLRPEVLHWLRQTRELGLQACLVSNSPAARVRRMAGLLGMPAVGRAGKPRRRAFRRAMDLLGTGPESTAVVGDQLFTDVLGGNRMGLLTVLVSPLAAREFVGTRMMRHLERLALGAMGIERE